MGPLQPLNRILCNNYMVKHHKVCSLGACRPLSLWFGSAVFLMVLHVPACTYMRAMMMLSSPLVPHIIMCNIGRRSLQLLA